MGVILNRGWFLQPKVISRRLDDQEELTIETEPGIILQVLAPDMEKKTREGLHNSKSSSSTRAGLLCGSTTLRHVPVFSFRKSTVFDYSRLG
jgi:hypothetical protein